MVDPTLHGAHADGATPLDPDEAVGLIPTHITTRGQLDAWEQANILQAQEWMFSRPHSEVLTREYATHLHRRMFSSTWRWAGVFRRTDKNIGVPWFTIPTRLEDLIENAKYWLANSTYDVDEAAVRFHHQLVAIHPFPNGNGRYGRLMVDALLLSLDCALFTWGGGELVKSGTPRDRYLAALREADRGQLGPLMEFVRS